MVSGARDRNAAGHFFGLPASSLPPPASHPSALEGSKRANGRGSMIVEDQALFDRSKGQGKRMSQDQRKLAANNLKGLNAVGSNGQMAVISNDIDGQDNVLNVASKGKDRGDPIRRGEINTDGCTGSNVGFPFTFPLPPLAQCVPLLFSPPRTAARATSSPKVWTPKSRLTSGRAATVRSRGR